MAKYLSQLNRKLQVGISSYTEDQTSLNVVGKVGIQTTEARKDFDVQGDALITGELSVDTQVRAADVLVSGVSTFRGKIAVGATILNPGLSLSLSLSFPIVFCFVIQNCGMDSSYFAEVEAPPFQVLIRVISPR